MGLKQSTLSNIFCLQGDFMIAGVHVFGCNLYLSLQTELPNCCPLATYLVIVALLLQIY
jgi:hypothetical protein